MRSNNSKQNNSEILKELYKETKKQSNPPKFFKKLKDLIEEIESYEEEYGCTI